MCVWVEGEECSSLCRQGDVAGESADANNLRALTTAFHLITETTQLRVARPVTRIQLTGIFIFAANVIKYTLSHFQNKQEIEKVNLRLVYS